MNERDEASLRDMLDAARHARTFMIGKTREMLDSDDMLSFAVVRALEIVGEAAGRISAETRATLQDIPWKDVIGMRNKIIHEYDQVDFNIVWVTVEENLPPLISALEKYLS